MRFFFRTFAIFSLTILLQAAATMAQYDTATVLGTVYDSSGAVLPASTLSLENTATGVVARRTANPI